MKLLLQGVLCIAAGWMSIAGAAEIVITRVDRVQDRYHVEFEVLIEGTVDRVRNIVADHARLQELSRSVVSSRLVTGQSGPDARIELVLRPCVLIVFCKTITKVSDVHIEPDASRIRYNAVPGLGDFHEARETITLVPAPPDGAPRVRFTYSAVLNPAFYVPPLAGTWLIRRAIIRDLEETSLRVERIVRQDRR
ncbi:MAG: SRPBCC family protein [Gammaproteobacteria bacterium]|nr:SRPBCC family protein [Gammaproteobacteria bacterium]